MNLLLLLSLMLFLSGCVSSSHTDESLRFSEITNTNQLNGVYRNAGGGNNYLSRIIWGNFDIKIDDKGTTLPHKEIEFLDVISAGNKLTVNAIKNDFVIYKKEYLIGRDFEITDGKIIWHKFAATTGDIVVGPSHEKIELGLDTNGNVKYRTTSSFAGLAYLIVPIAATSAYDIMFLKLNDNKIFDACNKTKMGVE